MAENGDVYLYQSAEIQEKKGIIPGWLWVVYIVLVVWGIYYLIRYWSIN